jgi:hypothetical protein
VCKKALTRGDLAKLGRSVRPLTIGSAKYPPNHRFRTMNAIAFFPSGLLAKPLSDCRVFGLQRLEEVQNLQNLHRFVGNADNGNSLIIIYVVDF